MPHRSNGHVYKKQNEPVGTQLSSTSVSEGGPVPLDKEIPMEETTTQTLDEANQVADEAIGAAKNRFGALQDELKTFSNKARRNAEEGWDKTRTMIHENPASAIGIALAAGAVLGALITACAKED